MTLVRYLFLCLFVCQQTNRKDIAGLSARDNHDNADNGADDGDDDDDDLDESQVCLSESPVGRAL